MISTSSYKPAYVNIAIALSLVPVLLVMAVIYSFSAQKAVESDETSGTITDTIVQLFVPDYDSLESAEQEEIYLKVSYFVRKAAHFSEFAALGFFLALHLYAINIKKPFEMRKTLAFIICVLYASFDEFHQKYVDGRSPSLKDVCIDSTGGLFGILLMSAVIFLFFKSYHKKKRIK